MFKTYLIDGSVKTICDNRNHCVEFGLQDDCGCCPHYEEIREAFFSD